MEQVMITGASGFVGSHLARYFLNLGHRVTGLGTSDRHPLSDEFENFEWVCADTTQEGPWQDHAGRAEIIVNLAGRSIFKPWTAAYRKQIEDSRILTTRNLVSALPRENSIRLFSTSAVGIYGDQGETPLPEDAAHGSDFLASVCRRWEAEARKAEDSGARVYIMRFGVVLGDKGGALSVMGPAFKWFVGGPLGSGRQWFPWIHIRDLIRAVAFLNESGTGSGSYNFAGPHPLRQAEFARALGHAMGRPAFFPAPAFAVRLFMGDLGAALLCSQHAIPRALSQSGFEFEFETAAAALADIYSRTPDPEKKIR